MEVVEWEFGRENKAHLHSKTRTRSPDRECLLVVVEETLSKASKNTYVYSLLAPARRLYAGRFEIQGEVAKELCAQKRRPSENTPAVDRPTLRN